MDESFQLRARRVPDGRQPAPLDFAMLTATLSAQAAASAAARAQARAAPPAEPIGLARGGLRPARLFQPCRSETAGKRVVKHNHREIYLGVSTFLQCSAAKAGNAAGAWWPDAREVLRYE
jgi:hypothetical protein